MSIAQMDWIQILMWSVVCHAASMRNTQIGFISKSQLDSRGSMRWIKRAKGLHGRLFFPRGVALFVAPGGLGVHVICQDFNRNCFRTLPWKS